MDSSLRMDEGTGDWTHDALLDAIGLACPLPVLKARRRLASMAEGARLLLLASDPMAAIDIPHLCREDGHALLRQARIARGGRDTLHFLIAARAGGRQMDPAAETA